MVNAPVVYVNNDKVANCGVDAAPSPLEAKVTCLKATCAGVSVPLSKTWWHAVQVFVGFHEYARLMELTTSQSQTGVQMLRLLAHRLL